MRNTITVALVSAIFITGSAFADEGYDLAKQKQCLTCHSMDKDSLAPSFHSIATRYKSQKNFDGALITQIISGSPSRGGNHWGTMKMPPPGARPAVSEAEANQLLDWIMGIKWEKPVL